MTEKPADIGMFVLLTELEPFGLDEGIIPDGCGSLSEQAAEFLFFGLVHAAGAGCGVGLDEGHDFHR